MRINLNKEKRVKIVDGITEYGPLMPPGLHDVADFPKREWYWRESGTSTAGVGYGRVRGLGKSGDRKIRVGLREPAGEVD